MNNISIPRIYLLIEGPGKAMDLAKEFIIQRTACLDAAHLFGEKVGAESYSSDKETGKIFGLSFQPGSVPGGWKSVGNTGRRGGKQIFRPKHGSDTLREMEGLPLISITPSVVAKELGIPTSIEFVNEAGAWAGSALASIPGQECGFAFESTEGPYLLWLPDIAKICERLTAEGSVAGRAGAKVADGLESYSPELEGCRRILREEWDLIVAQHALDAAKKASGQ